MAGRKNNRGERVRGAGPIRTVSLLAWLLAVVLLWGCAGDSPPGQASDGERQAPGATEKLGTPALGREDAPVVLTEHSDYQ